MVFVAETELPVDDYHELFQLDDMWMLGGMAIAPHRATKMDEFMAGLPWPARMGRAVAEGVAPPRPLGRNAVRDMLERYSDLKPSDGMFDLCTC